MFSFHVIQEISMLKWLFMMLAQAVIGTAIAQTETDTTHHRKLFVTSGMGWGFPMGETGDVLQSKFSNSLALDISLADPKYFLRPSLDFLTFGYNQQVADPDYSYLLEKGRSNFYILNLAGGIRKQIDKLNLYAFAGPGVGVIVEPRVLVASTTNKSTIDNISHLTPTLRGGVGADYKIGGFFLFIETAWLHNFRNIQDRQVNVISFFGGLKTDVTKLKDNVAKVIGIK